MGDIFEGVTCIISAVGADDYNNGCFARCNPFEISKRRILESPIRLRDGNSLTNTSEATKSTPLSRRDWIFQERLLSQCILSFGKLGLGFVRSYAYDMASEQDPEDWAYILDTPPLSSKSSAL